MPGKFTLSDLPDLRGKVAIVTGGTSGLGEISVRQLALKGCRVYFTARNASKAQASIQSAQDALKQITSSHNPLHAKDKAAVTLAEGQETLDVHVLECDLSSLADVKKTADSFLAKEKRLDILMNNAGVCAVDYALTKDGVEVQNGTNLVSHYYLSYLLLPLLRSTAQLPEYTNASADQPKSTRIVTMGSLGHKMISSTTSFDTLDSVNASFEKEKFAALKRYGMSKLGCLLFTRSLSQRLADLSSSDDKKSGAVSIVCCDPGQSRTGLANGPLEQYGAMFKVYIALTSWSWTSAEQAAQTQLFAATSPDVDARSLSGKYLVGNGKIQAMSKEAEDKDGKWTAQLENFVDGFLKEKVQFDPKQQLVKFNKATEEPAAAPAVEAGA